MSHKFRFTKESLIRMKNFVAGEKDPKLPPEEVPKEESPAEPQNEGPITVVALTDVGKVRASNQDSLIQGERLWGVADGMGGHNGGETASSEASKGLVNLLSGKEPSLDAMRTGVKAVNRRIFIQQQEDEKLAGMGTTLTALWFSEHFVYAGHVGDSRAYLLREGVFRQVTEDHSLVEELVRSGHLTREQAENHPMRNVITRAVGTEEGVDVDLMVEDRRKGDIWLVCSDGLHGLVSDKQMESILSSNKPKKAGRLLMDAALNAGGRDNISLVILVDKEGG